ncbi:MAG: sulfatase-like hydrolase/transferase, partial [Inhella sp.]
NTIVVISTDHGESFELGFLGHAGPELHDALIRGPLVIRLPGQQTGARHAHPVSQADLAPTLLDLTAAPALRESEGRSLRPLLDGKS